MNPSIEKLHTRLCTEVKGSETAAFELIASILAGGHVLIEGAPGVGKTTLAKSLATAFASDFQRVQFTPDLLPSDLLGYSMFRQDQQKFEFIEGPVFTNLLLADEINRTSPRIQSALLECMNEGQVTIDGKTWKLPAMFHVVATQNNRFSTGTFPLPEPQLDRFLTSIEMTLPQPVTQVEMLEYHLSDSNRSRREPIASIDDAIRWKEEVHALKVSRAICEYIVRLSEAVRKNREIEAGLSNRATIALTRMAQAVAWLHGHSAVFPDDVKRAFVPVLAHRLHPSQSDFGSKDRSFQRRNTIALLNAVLDQVEVD
ncbi:MAG: MoxR family ATPase [Verrucomicrobiales bacterium]|nr:MoxR family ATPase [Verrucomicrobiales bacterium]